MEQETGEKKNPPVIAKPVPVGRLNYQPRKLMSKRRNELRPE